MTLLDSIINYLDKISKLPETYCRAHIITLLDLLRGEQLTETQISYFGLEEVHKVLNSRTLISYFHGNPFEDYTEICSGTTDEELFEGLIQYIKSGKYGGNPEPILEKIKECKTIDEFLKKQEDGDYFFDVI